jgi:hypothetical protein
MGEIKIVLGVNRGMKVCGITHPTRMPLLDELMRVRKAVLSDAKVVVAFLEEFGEPNTIRLLELDIAILSNYVGISNQIAKLANEVIVSLIDIVPEEKKESMNEVIKLYETYIAPEVAKDVDSKETDKES